MLLVIGNQDYSLTLSEISLEVKILAAVEGIVARLRVAKDPEATLTLIKEGKWPMRRSAKPKLRPARVEAVMQVEDITEKEARDYLASVKGGKLSGPIMAAYHKIMADRLSE